MSENIDSSIVATDSNIIYHYCSCEKFYKIIENKELWLTYYKHMNDYKEKEYLNELLESIFTKLNETDSERVDIFNNLTRYDREILFKHDSYFACFSLNGDLLSQWVKYSDNANGFSIGFNKNVIINKIKCLKHNLCNDRRFSFCTYKHLNIQEIQYEDLDHHPFLERIIKHYMSEPCIPCYDGIDNYDYDSDLNDVCTFINELPEICNYIKNPFFKEEHEYRLILNEFSEFTFPKIIKPKKYRAVKNGLSPYYALDLSKFDNLIEKVILSPKNISNPDDIESFIKERFKDSNAISNTFTVEKSKGTYR